MFNNNNSASGWVGSGGSVREVQGLEIMHREGNTIKYKVNEMMILFAIYIFQSKALVTYNYIICRCCKSSEPCRKYACFSIASYGRYIQ